MSNLLEIRENMRLSPLQSRLPNSIAHLFSYAQPSTPSHGIWPAPCSTRLRAIDQHGFRRLPGVGLAVLLQPLRPITRNFRFEMKASLRAAGALRASRALRSPQPTPTLEPRFRADAARNLGRVLRGVTSRSPRQPSVARRPPFGALDLGPVNSELARTYGNIWPQATRSWLVHRATYGNRQLRVDPRIGSHMATANSKLVSVYGNIWPQATRSWLVHRATYGNRQLRVGTRLESGWRSPTRSRSSGPTISADPTRSCP